MRRKSKVDREEARRRERSLRQRQDEQGAVAHKSCATAFFMHKKSLHPSKRAEAGVK